MSVCEGCNKVDVCQIWQQQQADENGFCTDYIGDEYEFMDLDLCIVNGESYWIEMSWYQYTEDVLDTREDEYELFDWME